MTRKRVAKRGPRKMGSIYELPSGRWAWQDSITDPVTKKRTRPSAERATRDEVLVAREEILAKLARTGQAKPPTPGTVADWMGEWLRQVAARPGGASSTYANYEGASRVHIVPAIGHLNLAGLTSEKVAKMLAPKTKATRQMVHKTLSAAWHDAWQLQKVKDPEVVKRVPTVVPGMFASSPGRLDHDEKKKLLLSSMYEDDDDDGKEGMRAQDQVKVFRTIKPLRLRPRWLIGVVIGARQSEALGLAWPDLKVQSDGTGRLKIKRNRVRPEWAHGCSPLAPCPPLRTRAKCPKRIELDTWKETKTSGSKRTVYLTKELVDILLEWRARQAVELSLLDLVPDIPWMFTNVNGSAISHSSDRKDWQDVLGTADVSRHYSLHDMRHTAASEAAADMDTGTATVMRMLGWTKQSTADGYIHSRDDRTDDGWARQQRNMMSQGD